MKIVKTGLAAIILMQTACIKETIHPYSASQIVNNASVTDSFYIGQHYGGGIIFYLDSTKMHGFISGLKNLSDSTSWKNDMYITTGATGTTLGTGNRNTQQIVLSQGNTGKYAALLCANDTSGGYDDWFLPSRAELNILHQRRLLIPGLTGGNYWSSSESAYKKAWCQHFHGGLQFTANKKNIFHVRAVRAF